MKTALTIAGSDPTCGAGVQLDIKVFQRIGVHGLSVVTSITSQNTTGVKSVHPVDTGTVVEQLDVLIEDIRVDAIKTGMLYSSATVEAVSAVLKGAGLGNVVVDPVMASSSGMPLVEEGAVERMIEVLFPLATVVTPNIYEASLLSGMKIEDTDTLCEAAKKIKSFGPDAVVITGGHFPPSGDDTVVDLYHDGTDSIFFDSERIPGEYHGTGCAFTSALTAYLSMGEPPPVASRKAKEFVTAAVRKASKIGMGMGILGV